MDVFNPYKDFQDSTLNNEFIDYIYTRNILDGWKQEWLLNEVKKLKISQHKLHQFVFVEK